MTNQTRNEVLLEGIPVGAPEPSHENHGQLFYRQILEVPRLSGTADCGQSVDVYAETDETGIAVFKDIPIGSNYTLAEVAVPERYVEVAPQNVRIAWNEVTRQTVENRLVRGSIRGIKVGEADKPLSGAVFGLFAEGTTVFLENAAFAVVESSEDGGFSFENIPYLP